MSGVYLSKQEKNVPTVEIQSQIDNVPKSDPESTLQRSDDTKGGNEYGNNSNHFRPQVTSQLHYSRPSHFKTRRVGRVVSTKNGVFQPTLAGSHVAENRTPQMGRKPGVSGYSLPIDGLRLSQSALTLPVTRLDGK